MVFRIMFGTAALAALSASAAVGQPLARTTAARWVVDFDDTQCVATRNYGTEERPVYLAIKAPPLARIFQLAVIRPGSGGLPQQYDATITFDGGTPVKTSMLGFNANGRRIHLMNLQAAEFAPATRARSMRIRASGALDQSFQLDSMTALFSTIRTCVADLEAYWGGVVESPAGLAPAQPPTGTLAGIIKSEDYPLQAIDRMQEGSVQMIVLVNEQGRVADCTLAETSGVAVLDAQACYIIKDRARFKPATSGDGKAVRGMFRQRITWRID